MNKKLLQLGVGVSAMFLLAACSPSEDTSQEVEESSVETVDSGSHMETLIGSESESGLEMDGQDEADRVDTKDMVVPEEPFYEKGETVIVTADYASGMQDAQAEVTGVFETTIYEVSYEPQNGGEAVMNYKWVVQEDLEEEEEIYDIGQEVTLKTDHLPGMKGAKATIEDAFYGQIYMISYTDGDGKKVDNYQWVLADDLRPSDYQ